ncbi:anaphase-promoting complex subunit 2-like [Lotus japonicus]|uniref:anaphase-promoting complex subunit 2-like n=1 Tax=Lotus japonicus TaxID=34305 RepID=UPI0025852526|nr:anaphase-promoting complex subunit 2-like [Lotus japonicus]
MENVAETNKNGGSGNAQKLLGDDEEEDRSWDSVENQPRKEMAVYEYLHKFILGMLKNIGSMTLDRIHNMLMMFCNANKSQLQTFLSGLASEEKLELRDEIYILKY